MATLPSRDLAGKFVRVWSVSEGRERIVVGFYHPVNPFNLKPYELAYVKTFYSASEYKHELVSTYPGVKNPFMYSGFLVLMRHEYTPEEILDLWHKFEDVPMDPDSCKIEESFLHFPAGTDRLDVWKWFDVKWPKGVYDLLYFDMLHGPENEEVKNS